MEIAQQGGTASDSVQPYSIHVSVKYLQLTRRKLELTRLPREIKLPPGRDWELGTPKSALEPLIDEWLDKYSWRDQETAINQDLPQFRTNVQLPIPSEKEQQLRVHFVHRKSQAHNAIPLLYCHGHPGSFLEVSRIMGPLTSPIPTHLHSTEDSPSFHIVAPSIPGFGFSDVCELEDFGIAATAALFNELMIKLGYQKYVVHGSGWGYEIARMIAINHSDQCIAFHTSAARYSEHPIWKPQPTSQPSALRNLVSRLFAPQQPSAPTSSHCRKAPQTSSFALCDSPIGLLAMMLEQIHAAGHLHLWTASELLTWTMLLWLPGPEACLRWIYTARSEQLPTTASTVPFGVSLYQVPEEDMDTAEWTRGPTSSESWNPFRRKGVAPATGYEQLHNIVWVQKMRGEIGIPAWDSASDVILHLRRFCAVGRREGWLVSNHEQERSSSPITIVGINTNDDGRGNSNVDRGDIGDRGDVRVDEADEKSEPRKRFSLNHLFARKD